MKAFFVKSKSIIITFLLYIIVWYSAAAASGNSLIIPYPSSVINDFFSFFLKKSFYLSVLFTLTRFFAAFAFSLFLGVLLPILSISSKRFSNIIKPGILSLRSIPVISMILISLIWFSTDCASIFIGITVMLPIIYINVFDGLSDEKKDYLEFAKVFKISRIKTFRYIYFPSGIEFLFSSMSNAAGIGIKSVIAAEVIAKPILGIGSNMHSAQSYLKISELFAWTMTAVILALIIEYSIRLTEKRLIKWSFDDKT